MTENAPLMLAAVVEEPGPPEALQLRSIPRPVPGPGEVLVRVRAAGVNPVDWKVRSGRSSLLGPPPFVVGWDIAGEVEALGPGTSGFAVGDAVYGMPRFPQQAAAYAEYVSAPAADLAPSPRVSRVEAAALPLAVLTAWQALFETADLRAGQRVLIHAAAGGVGHLAVQLARWKGAHVIGTASARNAEFVRHLGADEVVDYTAGPFEDAVRDVDLVLDCVGGDVLQRSPAVVRPGGRLVTIAGAPPETPGITSTRILVRPSGSQLREIAALVDAGELRVNVDATFPLAEAAAAHRAVETGRTRGKVVLTIPE